MSENSILSEDKVNENNYIETDTAEIKAVSERLQTPEYVLSDESRADCRCAEIEFPVEKKLLYRLILFVVSALLLAFSFLPFSYIKADVGKLSQQRVPFNSVDSVIVLVSSLQNISEKNLIKSDEFKELEKYYIADYHEFYLVRLDGIKLNSAVKRVTFFNLKSQTSPMSAGYLLAALVSVGYFAVCFVFFIVSALSLLREFVKNKEGKHDTDKLFKTSIVLLWSVFLLVPLVGFSFLKMCYFSRGPIPAYTISDRGLGFGFFASLVIAGVFSVIAFVKMFRNLKRRQKGSLNYKTRRGLAVCALAIMLALTVLLPAITFRFYNDAGTRERAVFATTGEIEELGDEEMKSYLEVSRGDSYSALFEIRDEAMGKISDREAFYNHAYKTLLIGYRRINISDFHIAVVLLSAFMLFFAALTIIYSLRDVFFNSVSSMKLNIIKLLSFAAAVANAVFIILIHQNTNVTVVGALVDILSVELGIAPILMILSGFLLALSIRKPKKLKRIDKSYDNPDVSYAPYVLSGK